MRYTAKYFRENLLDWKKKRDPLTVRFVYRPISFFTAAFCANRNITANSVSNFSTVLGIIACVFLAIPNYITGIVGGILLNIWIILDCTDGNLARQVKKQPYGEFLDAMSSYLLIGFLFLALGVRSFYLADFFSSESNVLYVFGGALASICDILMSLLYQKYILVSQDFGVEGKLAYDGSNSSKMMRLKTFIDMNLSVGGVLPLLVLFSVIFNFTELVVMLWGTYYILEFIATLVYFIYKINQYNRQHR